MAERMTIREQVDRYNEALAGRGGQAEAATEAGKRSVRHVRYAVGIDRIGRGDLITRADKAGMTIGALVRLAKSLGIDVEQACSADVLSGVKPYTGSLGSDWEASRQANRAPPPPVTGAGLYSRLALLGAVAHPRALSINYRALAFGPEHISACSPWAKMRVRIDLGLGESICVDAADFLAMLKGAPDALVTVVIEGHTLRWTCGPARGHLAAIDAIVAPPASGPEGPRAAGEFGPGLELGSLACTASALTRNAGLEGVQIYNRDGRAYAAASDSTMISACCLGEALPLAKGAVVTLKPEAAGLLAAVVKREIEVYADTPHVSVDRTSLYCLATDTELQLHQLAPLDYDLADKLAPFQGRKRVMPLQRESIAAFIRRAEALAEVRAETLVELSVNDGTVTLTFREATGSTEEDYRVEGAPNLTVKPIRLEARRLARALAAADELVFDYVDKQVMILRGPNEFVFGVAARR